MNSKAKAILLSVLFGLLVWVLNALSDYFFFYHEPFLDLLILNVPPVELYIRLVVLFFFIGFGIIVAWRLGRRGRYEDNLLRRQHYLSCLAEISTDLLTTSDLGATLPHVLEHMRAAAGADRCYLFENHRGGSGELLTSQRFEVCVEGVKPQMDNPDLQNLPCVESGFSRWVEEMTAGRPIFGRVAGFPKKERAFLQQQDIHWILALPLHVSGEFYGFIGLDACRPDVRWGRQEIDLLRSTASSISAAVERSKSDERIRAVFEKIKDGIFIETLDGRILDVNEAACQMLGYTREELCAMHVGDVVPPSIAEKLPSMIQKETVGEGIYVETYNVRKDGTRVPVEVSNTFVEIGGEKRVIAVIRDITERKRAADELRAREEKYRALIETTDTGYLIVDGAGKVIDANLEYVRLTGHTTLDEIVGRTVIEWTAAHDKERNAAEVKKCGERGFVRNLEIDYVDKDGKIIPIEVNAKVVETGEGTRILALCRDITERKKAEEILRDNEQRMSLHVHQTPLGVIEWDLSFKVKKWNPAAEEIFGYSQKEAMGKHANFIVPNSARKHVDRVWSELLTEKGGTRSANANINKEGGLIFCEWYNTPLVNEQGEVIAVTSLVQDITERKRAQEELEGRAERVIRQRTAILELSQKPFTGFEDSIRRIAEIVARTLDVERVGIWFYNEDRSAIDCLEEYVQSTDTHRVGESLMVASYPAYFRALEESRFIAADDALNDPRTCEFADSYLSPFGITSMMDATIRLHGRTIGVICHEHVGPMREWRDEEQDFAGSMADMVSLAFEASERGKAEKDVQQLALAVEQAAETIIISDAKAGIQYVNPAFEETTGYRRDEVIGRTLAILKSGSHDDDFFREMWNTLRKGEVWRGRIVNRRKNGELYEEDVTMSPIRDRTGAITSYVEVRHDITQQVALEEQLRHAQKMEAIGTLAGGLAHDFNNILAGIMGYASLSKQVLEQGSPQHSDMEQIEQLSRRGAALTQALLTFSRKGKYHPRPLRVALVFEEVLGVLGRTAAKGIAIETDVAPDLSNIVGDEGQLSQVFMNLCLNACEAMHEGGTLRVEARDAMPSRAFYSLHPNLKKGRYVAVVISDTGRGIDPGTLGRIFEPFFTTKAEKSGTGLGLSIVNGIVEKHGGCIVVESEEGRGSTFTIYLPATDEEIPAPRLKLAGTLRGDETILVVDDEEGFRLSAVRWLTDLGYKTFAAASGEEALEIVGERKGEIDLVLLDMVMGGMDGTETFEEMRKLVPDLSVIICTGYSLDATARRVLEGGANGFLQKPFELTKLALKVRTVLDSR